MSTNGDTALIDIDPTVQIGSPGLRRSGGIIVEEFLPELQGLRGQQVLREMADNDPAVGAMLTTVDLNVRKLNWRCEPVDDSPAAQQTADFAWECLTDMQDTFPETMSQVFTFLPFGWAWHEVVFKTRQGRRPPPVEGVTGWKSKHDDKRTGFAGIFPRAQDTLLAWHFDDWQRVVAFEQRDWMTGQAFVIPASRSLHFRTTARKGNPEGRALDPATPIRTRDGWSTMGDLTAGSQVFDEQGRARYVTAVADWPDRPRYRLTFNDGSTIVADGEHEWPTRLLWERSKRMDAKLRTTAAIAATVKDSQGHTNHGIEWAGALDLPAQHLVADPWLVGLWLGDGTTLSATIAHHADDTDETVALIEQAGYPVKVLPNGDPNGNGRTLRVLGGFQRELRSLDLLGDKHVPAAYLAGSKAQRLALLAGLMDSDGHVDAWGRCEFVNTNERLIEGVAELVRSLGVGCTVGVRRHAVEGERSLTTWAVRFTPTWAPFRLARKAARCRTERAKAFHYVVACERIENGPTRCSTERAKAFHYVVACERIENGPTRCIEVDGPSHLFLAGTSLIPTHNSILRNAYRPWYFKRRIEEIEAIGIERDLAGLPMAQVPAQLLRTGASPADAALAQKLRETVRSVRRGEAEGLLWPLEYDSEGRELYKFSLLSSGGARQFDTSTVIARYDARILLAALTDFLLIGHEGTGGLGQTGLSVAKVDLFAQALEAWVDIVQAEFNDVAMPMLMELNGLSTDLAPRLTHDAVKEVDLTKLSTFAKDLAAAGYVMFPDPALEAWFRSLAGMPEAAADTNEDMGLQ